jgi:tight adherence protein B
MTRRASLMAALICACLFLGTSAVSADELGLQSVSATGWPQVTMLVTLPSAANGARPTAVRVWENGVEIQGASVKDLTSDRQGVDVVLVIDQSGSMKGSPLANARQAAARFVSLMGERDRIAIVAFGPSASVLTGFTSDPVVAASALSRLAASGETALYDGVGTGLGLFAADSSNRRAMVVLSDGKDTVSNTNLDTAVSAARAHGVPVYVVALKSTDYDPASLRVLASATGGRLTNVQQSSSLAAIYGAISAELQRAYRVSYSSRKPNTPDLEIRIVLEGAQVPLTKTSSIPNPQFVAAVPHVDPPSPPTWAESAVALLIRSGLAAMAAACAGLLGFVGLSAVIRGRRPIDELALYDQVQSTGLASASAYSSQADPSRLKVLGFVDQVASHGGLAVLANSKLERAGLPLRSSEYILLHFLGVLIVGLLAQVTVHSLVVTVPLVALATAGPLVALGAMERRRRIAFEAQLPDILLLVAGSLRAGWGLQQSIALVVEQSAEPAKTEFRRVDAEVRLGLPLDQALYRVAERLDSRDFRWTASAIAIQREVGGNLSEVLESLADTIRERASLARGVKALTAEGRFSAITMVILPFLLAFAMFFINPGYIGLLVTSSFGAAALATGVVLLVVGAIWLRRVVTIDV